MSLYLSFKTIQYALRYYPSIWALIVPGSKLKSAHVYAPFEFTCPVLIRRWLGPPPVTKVCARLWISVKCLIFYFEAVDFPRSIVLKCFYSLAFRRHSENNRGARPDTARVDLTGNALNQSTSGRFRNIRCHPYSFCSCRRHTCA